MPGYLLDTNVISEPLRRQPRPAVINFLETNRADLAIAAIVWHELTYGYHRLPDSRRKQAIGAYLMNVVGRGMAVLPYDRAAADWHAAERARLGRDGRPPPLADGQIAATTVAHDRTLVTLNGADFTPFDGLRVYRWSD